MAENEWDIRIALKAYQGDMDVVYVHNSLAQYINSPFFTTKQVADTSVQMLVRRIWWEFNRVDHTMFLDDGKGYLMALMDLAGFWRIRATNPGTNAAQKALLKYNSALIMMAVTEVLQDEGE